MVEVPACGFAQRLGQVTIGHGTLLTAALRALRLRRMRRAVGCGLLLLGLLVVAVPASHAQPVTPPTAPTSSTSTSTFSRVAVAGHGSTDRLPTLGEGFPWITVGAVILVAGLVGARLRRASRR